MRSMYFKCSRHNNLLYTRATKHHHVYCIYVHTSYMNACTIHIPVPCTQYFIMLSCVMAKMKKLSSANCCACREWNRRRKKISIFCKIDATLAVCRRRKNISCIKHKRKKKKKQWTECCRILQHVSSSLRHYVRYPFVQVLMVRLRYTYVYTMSMLMVRDWTDYREIYMVISIQRG